MASSTYKASTLKTCRDGSVWRSSYNYAGIGQGFENDSISRIGYLGFDFDLRGKYITKIDLKLSFEQSGLGGWATKYIDFYRYVDSSSPPSTVGEFIGGFSGKDMYYCTTTFTFEADNKADCFQGLKEYFESGGCKLIIKAPANDSKTHSYGEYTDSYALISSASITVEYVDTYQITYDLNGGSGTVLPTLHPDGIDSNITSDVPQPPPDSTVNRFTVTFDGNGGTPNKSSATNTATYEYVFDHWNTAADGSGTSYGSSSDINISAALTLYARYVVKSTTYSTITSATSTRDQSIDTCAIVLDYGYDYDESGTNLATLSSSSTTTYTCTGWYTAATGGTKRVNVNTSFTPSATETLYAQYSASATAYQTVIIPEPTREGYIFNGWVDSAGKSFSTGSYTPDGSTATFTITASWTPIKYTLTILDWMTGTTKYSATVDYGTTFTLPRYGMLTAEAPNGNIQELTFYDEETETSSVVEAGVIERYLFEGYFAKYEDDIFSGGPEGDMYYYQGQTVTITTNTEFNLVFAPDGEFMRFTTPPSPTAPFGKRFQGWRCLSTGEMYLANTTYTLVSEHQDFDGIWADVLGNYGKNLYFKVDGEMTLAKATYVKVNGQYREALAIFTKVDGRWKTKEG